MSVFLSFFLPQLYLWSTYCPPIHSPIPNLEDDPNSLGTFLHSLFRDCLFSLNVPLSAQWNMAYASDTSINPGAFHGSYYDKTYSETMRNMAALFSYPAKNKLICKRSCQH